MTTVQNVNGRHFIQLKDVSFLQQYLNIPTISAQVFSASLAELIRLHLFSSKHSHKT